MNTRFSITVILVILGLTSVGCHSGARLPCPGYDEPLIDLQTHSELVSLRLENNICMSICKLFIVPNHCEYTGGPNWVEGKPLRFGESVTRNIPPGKYFAWVELCSEEFRADENIRVRSDRTYQINDDPFRGGKPPCDTSLTIVNQTPDQICKLWISNTESAYTSWNWLGDQPIEPGESLSLELRTDTYIIRMEDCDDNWLLAEEAEISGHQIWTVP